MHLHQAVLLQRRVLQWLAPLVLLWAAIVLGLAFSGASVAQAEGTVPLPGLPEEKTQAFYRTHWLPPEGPTTDHDLALEPLNRVTVVVRALLIDGDPELPAEDLLPQRGIAIPPQKPLFVEGFCQTPMSLMLHSSFGTERMQLLAKEILVRGLRTTTYREVEEGLRRGECPGPNLIIVSLDDFGTDWLRPHFQSMIQAFTDRGLRLVVAVVVHGHQDPDAWSYLRELEALGNEVANHSIDHYNLARLEPADVNRQVKGAHQIICHNLGGCPKTLILPFGNIDRNGNVQAAAAGYSFIVGIPAGRTFGGEAPYYLGRIGPDNLDQRQTLTELAGSFRIGPSAATEFLAFRESSRGCAAGPSPAGTLRMAACVPSSSQAASATGQAKPAAP